MFYVLQQIILFLFNQNLQTIVVLYDIETDKFKNVNNFQLFFNMVIQKIIVFL